MRFACSLWPVLASGFSDLVSRGEVQANTNAENKARMDAIKDLVHKLRIRLVRGCFCWVLLGSACALYAWMPLLLWRQYSETLMQDTHACCGHDDLSPWQQHQHVASCVHLFLVSCMYYGVTNVTCMLPAGGGAWCAH